MDVSKHFIWSVPEAWSLEDAATIPVVYTTAYYALVIRANIRHGDKVLVHSGSGGVGQAAISIALSYGCLVFTTVGSPEKKEYLKNRFPQLTDGNFFNSRDATFEKGILTATKGTGKMAKPISYLVCNLIIKATHYHVTVVAVSYLLQTSFILL